ncbi:UDP-N-acetylmuramoylalanine--D-glutamate ligase [candidate division WOR-1 bacterium RIFOXYB2_FULL_48_7]|uniref:UDP-N-acetylmuramoylalanine--D-glutamate ligase n=1 Tax=candidate division WOR-1 bacterium RIFOXYB2_FULL_48_7 TaxID=1802583 RepID=A0A1F4TM45_UNCSA|nr:MAG: UDP-N-acetylmuramoylalanine--D-glutamate ligase [candidate division WOR-1 bacterium RIFOXYB2_FULL_48_7]
MLFKGKKVVIYGLGKSGSSVARKLAGLGAKVLISDGKTKDKFAPGLISELQALGADFEFAGHTAGAITGADLIVLSPGVHLDLPVLEEAARTGIQIISEIELACQFLTKPLIAITGTNGKTTTTTLIGEMLKAAGKSIAVAGNIGLPLIEIDDKGLDYIVVEISSYQLEGSRAFHPHISVILNIQPDHLERHHTMTEYIKQKTKIFLNQTGDDYLVFNEADPQVAAMVAGASAKLIGFDQQRANEIITLKPEEIKIPGRHNLENALAAAQVAYLCGVKKEIVAQVLKHFPGVEHRIEYVDTINGVEYRNDSKGTNPDSTMVALETFAGRGIVLILGGKDKGVDLMPLVNKIKSLVRHVILLGEAAPLFAATLRQNGYQHYSEVGYSLAKAVALASQLSRAGEVVLFSPACASFDMFNNYEERGKMFKELCQKLKIK